MTLGGRKFHVSASVGIAVFPEHGDTGVTLLSAADAAMYCAKEAGRNRTEWYVSAMSARTVDRLDLESDLREALERGEFVLHYQPQANVRTGEITGVEALVRWNRPEHGLVPPAEFIPVAEETGLIVPIGKWVLETACSQARAWHEAGLSDLRIAVNLSARQLNEPDLLATVKHALATSTIDPALLEVEITESLAMDDANLTSRVLGELKRENVHVAIDDFGTGYSSLSYLKHFPIRRIKIDRSFVRDVTTDPNDAAIVVATIAMARGLGVEVIAEGIETEEQLDFLREQGCEEYQGYLLGKPMPADKITEALAAWRTAGGQRPPLRQAKSAAARSAR
jgi:EAL domain-containing protein (putative c-di-GMP-specific phosphodiesterase class I)